MAAYKSRIPEIVSSNEKTILKEWTEEQLKWTGGKISSNELTQLCQEFMRAFTQAIQSGDLSEMTHEAWKPVKSMLTEMSRTRGLQGFSPSETATFVFSLKRPMFTQLQKSFGNDIQNFASEVWTMNSLLDQLGLLTTEAYQKGREEVIARQQEDMLELSTPVVKLWDGILALPMIGTLDSGRTQVVMESLLQRIVETNSEIAIIDITGVPTVDTLVAQHLIKTVTAARLMGAECIISGIRPQIAATIVHLGVDLGGVATKASLADAFMLALSRTGRSVGRAGLAGANAGLAASAPRSALSNGAQREVRA